MLHGSWRVDSMKRVEEGMCRFSVKEDLSMLRIYGRAIAQAVSHRLPTAAARVRARVKSFRICGGQSGTGVGFLRVFWFPQPVRIPPIAPQSSSSGTRIIAQRAAAVPSGLSLTQWEKKKASNLDYDYEVLTGAQWRSIFQRGQILSIKSFSSSVCFLFVLLLAWLPLGS
jgi:hypothetical protein